MVINYSGKKILHTILKKNDFPSKKNYHVIIISYLIISQLPSKKENNFLSKKKSTSKKKTSYTYQKINRFSKRKNLFMPARNKFLQLSEKNKFPRQKNPYNYWKKQFFKQGTSYICLKKKDFLYLPEKVKLVHIRYVLNTTLLFFMLHPPVTSKPTMLTLSEPLKKCKNFYDSICALVKSNRIEKVLKY